MAVEPDLTDRDYLEAMSRRYVSPLVLPLESGRYAVMDPRREIVAIVDATELSKALRSVDFMQYAVRPRDEFPADVRDLI